MNIENINNDIENANHISKLTDLSVCMSYIRVNTHRSLLSVIWVLVAQWLELLTVWTSTRHYNLLSAIWVLVAQWLELLTVWTSTRHCNLRSAIWVLVAQWLESHQRSEGCGFNSHLGLRIFLSLRKSLSNKLWFEYQAIKCTLNLNTIHKSPLYLRSNHLS